ACAHDALVANVVDCQYRTGSGEQPVPRVTRLQVKGDQRRVPVVAVKDVGREAHVLAHLDRGSGEQQETQVLVVIRRVDAVALVELRATQEVQRYVGAGEEGSVDGVPAFVAPEPHRHVLQVLHRQNLEL